MAFHGDLTSFPLPELLQWLDGSRKSGALQLLGPGLDRRIFLFAGQVVAVASPGQWERIARLLSQARLASGEDTLAALREMAESPDPHTPFTSRGLRSASSRALAKESVTGTVADLISAQDGQFHWTEDPDREGEEWVPVELGVRELLFEALRWVDERHEVERTLPSETARVWATAQPSVAQPLWAQVLLSLCVKGRALGQLRLDLGCSRTSVSRRVHDLLRQRWVRVEGDPDLQEDPVADMLEKGAALVRERQFDAASLVFSSLLSSDPSDRRVREFARLVESEHVAALYRELPPVAVPALLNDPEAMARIRTEERQLAALINGSWDVATLVLASQCRELDTLKALARLRRQGLVEL